MFKGLNAPSFKVSALVDGSLRVHCFKELQD